MTRSVQSMWPICATAAISVAYMFTVVWHLIHRPTSPKTMESEFSNINDAGGRVAVVAGLISNLQIMSTIHLGPSVPLWIRGLFKGILQITSIIGLIVEQPGCMAPGIGEWNVWLFSVFFPIVLILAGASAILLHRCCFSRQRSAAFKATVVAMLTYILNEGLFLQVAKKLIDAVECENENESGEWKLTRMDQSECTMTLQGFRWQGVLASGMFLIYCLLPILFVQLFTDSFEYESNQTICSGRFKCDTARSVYN